MVSAGVRQVAALCEGWGSEEQHWYGITLLFALCELEKLGIEIVNQTQVAHEVRSVALPHHKTSSYTLDWWCVCVCRGVYRGFTQP